MPDNMPSVDELIQQRDKQSTQRLQQQFGQANSVIDQEFNYGRQAIMDQYQIVDKEQRRQYNAERDPKRKAAIKERMHGIVAQYEGKLKTLDNKFLPDRQKLETAMKAETQKMQQANAQRDFRLQTIRQLTQMGTITDPALAQQAEYKALGIDIPIAELRPKSSPEQKKASLVRDIKNLDATLKRFTPEKERTLSDIRWWGKKNAKIVDPLTGEERKLSPKDEGDKAIIGQMNALAERREQLRGEFQNLLMQEDPRYRQTVQDQQDRKRAKDIYMGNGGKGGGIKESLTNAVTKQGRPLDKDTAIRILQQAGGDKAKARQIAKSQGYKL